MPPIRIYVMRPLGPAGPWHVSVNGSEGESSRTKNQLCAPHWTWPGVSAGWGIPPKCGRKALAASGRRFGRDGKARTRHAAALSPGYQARKTVSARSSASDNSTTAEA
jgi:hypothetical protein